MPQIQKTLTLTIDDQAYAVEKMSSQIQQLVAMFDEWRQEEQDAQSKLLLVRAGLRDIQREIYNVIVAEAEAAKAEAEKKDAETETTVSVGGGDSEEK